jgi:hypothetical protein
MHGLRTSIASLALAAGLGVPAGAGAVPIDPGGPTTGWTVVPYAAAPDGPDDQGGSGANAEADIVGDAAHPAFYTAFDDAGTAALTDGMLGFRVRLGAETNPAGFSFVATVGIDGDDDGALDLFVLVDKTGGGNPIRILDAGVGANTSPSTTSIPATGLTYADTGTNYNWSPVTIAIDPSATIFDVDADGNQDRFVSFVVPFQDLVNRLALNGVSNVDQDTPLRYVLWTSTNASSLNRDLAGPGSSFDPNSTWDALGALSLRQSAAGGPVPEPGTGLLLGLGLLGLGCARRRR